MEELRKNNFLHLDIKPDNFVMDAGIRMRIAASMKSQSQAVTASVEHYFATAPKLIDFGLSEHVDQKGLNVHDDMKVTTWWR